MTLETARLLLRPFAREDAGDVHVYASDPAVCRFTDWGPNSLEDTQGWLEEAVAAGVPSHWAITLRDDAVGTAGRIAAATVVGGWACMARIAAASRTPPRCGSSGGWCDATCGAAASRPRR
ncbi:GNAT family N-acetyltransferase [Demequina sediminis]|uniref:GNAT family N-acetyltransferase n=1 Tax=Demequina sediminis TaxID=1930058 RepID=UPI003CD0A743